jgi:NADPH-dependent 2,4-dienoyl-CoA reductase/sulfur reductase-like enzyme
MSDGIVIAGGGLAAQRCAETLRAKGCDLPIRVVCAEHHPPYDRPPLSKELLAGAMPEAAISLRPSAWYADRAVDLLLGVRAERLDLNGRRLVLGDGRELRYDALLIATGARSRTLPLLAGFENVVVLRTIDDALHLRASLVPGARFVVVGGGFVGLEVAATARSLGVDVTIVETAAAPLAAALGTELGTWFARLHRAEGVDVIVSSGIASVDGTRRVESVELADGRSIGCDHVLVGVGVDPATAWLTSTGLDTRGVQVDAEGRTSARDVYAAGDAARQFDPLLGRHVATDHWEAAARQGASAARAMLGIEPAPFALPSFWSDQYGTRVQMVGRPAGADAVELHGDPESRDFAARFSRWGVPVAELLVGRPRALPEARRRVQAGIESLNDQIRR